MISFSEYVDSQEIGSTVIHHLPHGGEGLEIRIKNTSSEGTDVTG